MKNKLLFTSFAGYRRKSIGLSVGLWLLLGVMVIIGCKSYRAGKGNEASVAGGKEVPWILKHGRGPCYGQCPVYEFYLLEDHTGLIEVKANLMEPGWYESPLDQESLHYLLADIEPQAWWDEDLSDEPVIADLPSLSLFYKHKEGMRSFFSQGKMSDAKSHVLQQISHLVTEARWQPTLRRPLSPDPPQPTDLIVLLQDGVNVQEWMKKYQSYGIKLKKRLNPDAQYYVVTKNPEMGTANDFYQYILRDEQVKGARWQQDVSGQRK